MSRATLASHTRAAEPGRPPRLIFIACPWTPVGGGMYKIADYLIQSQDPGASTGGHRARLAPLDTRGGRHPALGLPVLGSAIARVAWARARGQLAGVHVNMAERMSLVRKGVLIAACRLMDVPVVLHLHAAQLHRLWPRLPALAQSMVRWVFSLPACCIVLGQASARFVTSELGVPRARVVVVINGVPDATARGSTAPECGEAAADGTLRLLFVGNLSQRKGVPELLQALSLQPLSQMKVHLTLAGGGDIDHYQQEARRLGVAARVRFAGWTEQAGVGALLAHSDVLVLPSHDEGLPLAILEALAHGVAVVCTPVGEIPDVLTDGLDAVFVPPRQPQALSQAIADLGRDRQRRTAIAKAGLALHQQRLNLPAFLEAIAAVHRRHFGAAAAWRAHGAAEPGTQGRP